MPSPTGRSPATPAAVVPLEARLSDTIMQRIAFEHGLSETAFFVRTGPARFHLRWFTPAIEVDLCGHATLATAHAIFHELGQAAKPSPSTRTLALSSSPTARMENLRSISRRSPPLPSSPHSCPRR